MAIGTFTKKISLPETTFGSDSIVASVAWA